MRLKFGKREKFIIDPCFEVINEDTGDCVAIYYEEACEVVVEGDVNIVEGGREAVLAFLADYLA